MSDTTDATTGEDGIDADGEESDGGDSAGRITAELNAVRNETGYGWTRTFGDWVRVVFASIRRDDETYLDIERRYEDEYGRDTTEVVYERYGRAFGILLESADDPEQEALGEVHQTVGIKSKDDGQFFTNFMLAEAMGGLTVSAEDIEAATPENPYRVGDPTCGSGRLLVGAGRRIAEIDPECPAVFVGQDINSVCARMTAINLWMHGLPGYAVHGDTFKPDPVASWSIHLGGPSDPPISEVDIAPFAP